MNEVLCERKLMNKHLTQKILIYSKINRHQLIALYRRFPIFSINVFMQNLVGSALCKLGKQSDQKGNIFFSVTPIYSVQN